MKKNPSLNAALLAAGFVLAGHAQAVSGIRVTTAGNVQTLSFGAHINLDYDSNSGLTVFASGITAAEGSSVSYTPLAAPAGLTAITLEHHLAGVRNATSDVKASADLATGKLRAFAAADGNLDPFTGGASSAQVRLYDTLHFNVEGASGTAILRAHVDGTIFLNPYGADSNWTDQLVFGGSQYSYYAANNQATSIFGFTDAGGNPAISGWDSFVTSNISPTGHDFTGTFTVHNGDVRGFSRQFGINRCYTHASCDFLNTASFTLELSNNVNYTSDSGVFLSAVPEPQSHALLIAGLGLIGWFARRRRV